METKLIERIAAELPPDSPYFDEVRRGQSPGGLTTQERLRIIQLDTAFSWHLGNAYARSGDLFPPFLSGQPAFRVYRHVAATESQDQPLAKAYAIHQREPHRDLLRAVLIAKDASRGEISKRCGIDPEVVSVFSAVFWDPSDLVATGLYLSSQLSPETDQHYEGTFTRHGMWLLRLAFSDGSRAVMEAARWDPLKSMLGWQMHDAAQTVSL